MIAQAEMCCWLACEGWGLEFLLFSGGGGLVFLSPDGAGGGVLVFLGRSRTEIRRTTPLQVKNDKSLGFEVQTYI